MDIILHGAGKEVGRSCVEVIAKDNKRYLLDAGLKITPTIPEFPVSIKNIQKIDAMFFSHIHLDHTGAFPHLYAAGLRCPAYATKMTKALMPILLRDSWKIAKIEGYDISYHKEDIEKAIQSVQIFPSQTESMQVGETKVTTFEAGHVPGARSILLDVCGERFLYSGDINLTENVVTPALDLNNYPTDVDVLVIESTYGDKDHPNRNDTEEELFSKITQTLGNGGTVIVPTFSIGRAQELLILITEKFPDVPIFLDGMAKKVTEIFMNNGVQDTQRLKTAFSIAQCVEHQGQRKHVLNEQCIVITTSGMLDGGPVLHYLPQVASDPINSVLMTGYQAEETNGRRLLNEGYIIADDQKINVKCFVKNYDLSGHAGATQLLDVIKHTKPKQVILNHGNVEKMILLKERIKNETNIPCKILEIGERFSTN